MHIYITNISVFFVHWFGPHFLS